MPAIRNPIEFTADQLGAATEHLGSIRHAVRGTARDAAEPQVRRIGTEDLREALRRGLADFMACRTDVAFICIVYPIVGILLSWFFFDYRLMPLIFPAASGFALVGPFLAIGLYEMSRRRERGEDAGWMSALNVLGSPSFGAIFLLGLGLFIVFALWMVTAWGIWSATLGPEPETSVGGFLREVIFTGAGWAMAIIGCAVGFLFAIVVLAVSLVSFPLLLDRDVGLRMAVTTSVRVAGENPRTVLAWGAIVAAGLVLGSLPLFLGLIFVMPVLGHATWHLYRRAVVAPEDAASTRDA